MVKEPHPCFWKVERGFSAHITGTYTSPPHFNYENCSKPLKIFFKLISDVKEERWAKLLSDEGEEGASGIDSLSGSGTVLGDQSMISAYREMMYVLSSPIKLWSSFFIRNILDNYPIVSLIHFCDQIFPETIVCPLFNFLYIDVHSARFFTGFLGFCQFLGFP